MKKAAELREKAKVDAVERAYAEQPKGQYAVEDYGANCWIEGYRMALADMLEEAGRGGVIRAHRRLDAVAAEVAGK